MAIVGTLALKEVILHISDVLRTLYKGRGHSLVTWGEVVGVKSSVMGRLLSTGNPKLGSLIRYIAPLGYQVALVPTGTKLPDGAYVIDSSGPKPEPAPYDLDDPDLLIG